MKHEQKHGKYQTRECENAGTTRRLTSVVALRGRELRRLSLPWQGSTTVSIVQTGKAARNRREGPLLVTSPSEGQRIRVGVSDSGLTYKQAQGASPQRKSWC
eukprot:1465124-Rhodomonas_salina.2